MAQLRLIVRTDDAGMAANVGGSVLTTFKTFYVDGPEVEKFLREFSDAKKFPFTHRQVIGVELVE